MAYMGIWEELLIWRHIFPSFPFNFVLEWHIPQPKCFSILWAEELLYKVIQGTNHNLWTSYQVQLIHFPYAWFTFEPFPSVQCEPLDLIKDMLRDWLGEGEGTVATTGEGTIAFCLVVESMLKQQWFYNVLLHSTKLHYCTAWRECGSRTCCRKMLRWLA